MDIAAFAEKVREYRRLTGASVTSWGRTPTHNKLVGGAPTSKHLTDLAVDVVYDAPTSEQDRSREAEHCGLRLYVEGDHDHLEAPPPITEG